MTLNKKRSRPIIVKGNNYRWAFTGEDGDGGGVIVQHECGKGSKLHVCFDWVGGEHPFAYREVVGPGHTRHWVEVKPSLVSNLIEQALAKGWSPLIGGRDFVCLLNEDQTIEIAN